MTINADQLATALAERFAEIAPRGFRIAAGNGMIRYSGDSGGGTADAHVRDSIGVFGESDDENAIGIGVQALDGLQDFISEATGDPWPGISRQPIPHGEIRDSFLYLWYGDPDNIVLACAPINMATFTH